MTAVLLAFASAAFLGGGVVITQFGLRTVHPLSGAAISIPSFTVVFLLLSPILLRGETIVWQAVPIFAAVGLVFPVLLTLLTFASNRALGPVAASALGNLSPLFSVAIAVLVLLEPLRPLQFAPPTGATGGPGRCCCRSAHRCCAASFPRSSRSALKSGRARSPPA
jgi:drug/metabolite transporter (DMT)-like permease